MAAPSVYEFRNYTTQPGRRDMLIEMFEREFIESQEAVGSRVVATFRNLDDANRLVWMRAFTNMETRTAALEAFYTSPLWRSLRNEANAAMVDSDNVLLLRPLSGNALRDARPPIGAREASSSVMVAATYFLHPGAGQDFAAFYAREVAPALERPPLATFATEHSPNAFPALPVRENETVFLTLTWFANVEAQMAAPVLDARSAAEITRQIVKPIETLRLQPTARSALR